MSYNKHEHRAARRHALALMGAAVLATALPVRAQGTREVRIGYQKYGTLTLLKGRGTLEQRLAGQGVTVKWTEFPAGPVLLEGLNVGSIDFGTVGEAPPIFAQAAGANLVYVGHEPPSPASEAIVVPKGSPLRTLADLKGKKIALNKGSNVHYLLVKALEKAGIAYKDVQTVFLPPADARAAFERGAVDAWVIWDPFQAAAEVSIGAREIRNGEGLVPNHQFYLGTKSFVAEDPKVVDALLAAIAETDDWVKANTRAAADTLSPSVGIPAEILKVALDRQSYGVTPLDDAVVKQQQAIADTFFKLGLIPKAVSVADATYKPQS